MTSRSAVWLGGITGLLRDHTLVFDALSSALH